MQRGFKSRLNSLPVAFIFGQIHFVILPNTFWNLNKYVLRLGQICSADWYSIHQLQTVICHLYELMFQDPFLAAVNSGADL